MFLMTPRLAIMTEALSMLGSSFKTLADKNVDGEADAIKGTGKEP